MHRRYFLRGLAAALQPPADTAPPDDVVHFLNRVTYGPRPEEVARCREIGIEAYLEEQLNPAQLDDSEAERRLRRLPILRLGREDIYRISDIYYRPMMALVAGMVTRAVYSRRQLLERVTEFWADHFNVPIQENEYIPDSVLFQRDVIHANALGRFRDLLFGSAQSPAMLVYLDNFVNMAEAPNENYARELLELHTLGVDGGYTEADVAEVARAFTGWSVHPRTGFWFNAEEHDTAEKRVLGHTLPAGRGIADGLHVLSILTNHPATARYISTKLIRRFVSDSPPPDLVSSSSEVWQQTGGNIKAVLRHILLSDAFFASKGQKFRRPLDFFIGALRATGTEVVETEVAVETLRTLGQVPYHWQPPDGYPDTATAWLNGGGLLARWNVAEWLTHTAASTEAYGLTTNLVARVAGAGTVDELVDAVATQVFGAPVRGQTREVFRNYVGDGPLTAQRKAQTVTTLYQLMLASPEFQWR
jgi:uncharacterized protein (DUF1800 family)